MSRSRKILTVLSGSSLMLLASTSPALAQVEYSGDEGLAFFILCCYGIFGLVALALFALWVWMIIDLFQRQEYEFPGSTGNSKTIWTVVMLVTWVVGLSGFAAIAYYFMIYKKVKRGTLQPPSTGGGYVPPAGGAASPPPAPPAGGGQAPPPPPPV